MLTKLPRFLLLGLCGWPLLAGAPASTRAAASSTGSGQLDVGLFYDTLKDDGSWFNTVEFGDVWQPYIAYKNDAWRPYTDGYWTYTDGGWMFVSYENFGWAVYHYGRWTQLKDLGWAWVPGTEWSPAWVTWRESKPGDDAEGGQPTAKVAATDTVPADVAPNPPRESPGGGGEAPATAVSENYIGWAPLPPDPQPLAAGSYYSYGPTVDVDYDIDPYDYCFTDVRFFGAPWVGGVIFDRDRSYYCAERSVNVTNLYYNRQGAYRGFFNGGPRYERFNGVTERPIPRLSLRREEGRAARDAIRTGRFNQIDGNRLSAVAPRFSSANVRNGRVSFKNRGALPVTPVDRDRPAAQTGGEARDRARSAFRQQGEDFRAKNPDSQSARRAARQGVRQQPAGPSGNAPGTDASAQARQEEKASRRAARQAARQEGAPNKAGRGPGGGGQSDNPAAAAANRAGSKAERRAARQETRRQQQRATATTSPGGGGDVARQQAREARRAARQEAEAGSRRAERQAAGRAFREPRQGGGEGFRGGRAMRPGGGGGEGFGGGRAVRVGGEGGGGRPRAGGDGGGGHRGGGHGGGRDRHEH